MRLSPRKHTSFRLGRSTRGLNPEANELSETCGTKTKTGTAESSLEKRMLSPRKYLSTRFTKSSKLSSPMEHCDTKTVTSTTTATTLSKSIPSLAVDKEVIRQETARHKPPAREPSLETGEGYNGLQTFLNKYDRITDSTLSFDSGDLCVSGRNGAKHPTLSTARQHPRQSASRPASRSVCEGNASNSSLQAVMPEEKVVQRRPKTTRGGKKKRTSSTATKSGGVNLQTFFSEYDQIITSSEGCVSVTGW